jgi:hypothetical protein
MSLQDRLKAPPAEDILYEHLGYSIDLVAMALREIGEAQHSDGAREWYRQMSIIEVFWSQARLLIEFFNGSAGSTNTTAAAHFTNAPMIYDFAFGEKDIEKMMNDQIAHMNSERTCDPTKKLRSADMWRVGSAIGRALEQFVESLTDESREVWQIRKSGYQTISADYVYAPQTRDTSSAAPQVLQTTSFGAAGESTFKTVGVDGPKGPEGPTGASRQFGPTGPLGTTGPLGPPRR